MDISQIQLNYIDVEDRMLLRINLGKENHLSLLLTRRIVRFMLDSFSVLLQRATVPPPEGSSSPAQRERKKDAAMPEATQALENQLPFEERAPEGNVLNLGAAAVLVANAACQQTETGLTFSFFIEPLQPVTLNLSTHLALGLSGLVTELSQRAQWFGPSPAGQRENSENVLNDFMSNQGSVTYH